MTDSALLFMGIAWLCVLSLTGWAFYRLLSDKRDDQQLPPPGTSL